MVTPPSAAASPANNSAADAVNAKGKEHT